MTAYDTSNPFAKILRGEFPCYKVYEDDHVLAFLDIMPRCPGHTLVIPKAPARNILDIGQVVFHLHMHVMPRHDGVALLPPASRKEDGKVLEENAARLIAALKGA